MFKAINTTSNEAIISLDIMGEAETAEARRKGQEGSLCCQVCREPVFLKAGTERRTHFAHKTLRNCPTRNEPADILEARAVLYQWLRSKFGDVATIERQVDNSDLSRPFDCWVTREEDNLAYWLIGKRVPFEELASIERAAEKNNAHLTWTFLSKVLRRPERVPSSVSLSTTERHCLKNSDYDAAYERTSRGTLHYIDSDRTTIATLRALHCVHHPQMYAGHEIRTTMSEVLVAPKTGEFVHPGEHDKLEVTRRKSRERKERNRREADESRRMAEEAQARMTDPSGQRHRPERRLAAMSYPTPPSGANREAICTECDQVTTDWWMYDGKTDTCRCNVCRRRREGRS
jgi:hypothetical protein